MVWVMVRGVEETEKGRERVVKTSEMVSTEMTKGMGYRQFQPCARYYSSCLTQTFEGKRWQQRLRPMEGQMERQMG